MSVTIQVFDPAMCCSTGICGPSVEPQLIGFAADLEWLQSRGVSVERFNLAQQPKAFAESAAAKLALEGKGEAALPLIIVDGAEKSSGTYPSRKQLAEWAGVVCESEPPEANKATSGSCCGGSKASGDASKKSKCC